MQCHDLRIKSFEAVARPKRLAKVAFPLSPAEYPNLTPAKLADAGFYHEPTRESDPDGHDTCKCFLCGLVLGGWDVDDNPHVEHVKREGDCAWKELVCRLEADAAEGGPGRRREAYPTIDSLPSSKAMATLREETFGDWWPHQKPSVKDVAAAGFIYSPSQSAPDCTKCPLCGYEVIEWEGTDEPWGIHLRKEPNCPFFTATVGKKGRASTRGGKTTARRGRSTVTTAREPEPEPQPEPADDSLELPEVPPEEEAPAPRRRGRPPKASTAPTSSAGSRSSRAASRGASRVPESDAEASQAEEQPAPRRRGRVPKASTSTASEPPASSSSKPTRGTRKTAVAKTQEEEAKKGEVVELNEAKPEPEDPTAGAAPATKPPTELEPAPEAESKPEAEPESEPEKKESRRATKPLPKKRTIRKTTTTESAPAADAVEPAPAPAPKRGRPKKSAAAPAADSAKVAFASAGGEASATNTHVPSSKSAPAARSQPLAEADSVSNVPTPPMSPGLSLKAASPQLAVGAFLHEVASPFKALISAASPGPQSAAAASAPKPTLPSLTDAQRRMTLEEYIRQQHALRADEMRADGEAMIQKFEAAAKEGRALLVQRTQG